MACSTADSAPTSTAIRVRSNAFRSALGYIPESTWNDSTTSNGDISANVPYVNSSTSQTNIIGGTGGASNCSTNTTTYNSTTGVTTAGTCTSGWPKPSWQTGPGVPSDGDRDVPDVSLMAGNGFYGATWLVCTDDTGPNSNNVTVSENCTNQSDNNFYFAGIGGTSASTPAFAGILALVVQANGGRIGMDGAKFLYDIYNSSSGAAVFHDVTQGNNSVLCTEGTPDCQAVGSSFFESGYNAGAGYDLATGLGSVDATQLIAGYAALSGGGGGGGTSGTFSMPTPTNPAAISPGGSASATISVNGSNGYAGSVSFACSLTTSPTGAVDLPTCSAGSAVTLSSSTTSGTSTMTVATTPPALASLDRRGLPGWLGPGGGTVLALLIFLGIPARRRGWRNLLGLLVVFAFLGTLSACGGGSNGGGGGGGGGDPGTTPGAYVFTVTGTGTPGGGGPYTTTFTVTVN